MANDYGTIPSARAATREDELRAATWTLLGNLLAAPPDDRVLGVLRGIAMTSDEGQGDAMAEAWHELRRASEAADPEALNVEFHDLFIGVAGGELTPYSSWYQTGSLMERPLIRLRQDLQQLGLERQEGNSDPEDHAAAVCDVMALVISDEDVSYDWQREIFQKHVEPWMDRFFNDVKGAENAKFYRAVGRLGGAFFALEQEYFSMLA